MTYLENNLVYTYKYYLIFYSLYQEFYQVRYSKITEKTCNFSLHNINNSITVL